ncbi:hypothetical protein [Neobacillus sp.]|uniref:PilN domain-containing protein n=1 Tax=Neobacillus sp. TaxID=2675273 RepID=UPI00289FE488|nr:hypothetical protein [Neobacillus sp.]
MLVDINLLPQKEPKKYGFIITISSLLALFVLIGSFYYWQTHSTKGELTSLDRQIAMTKKIAEKEEQNSKAVESSSSTSKLKSAIEWADDYSIQTIPVMRHLTSLLPARGFIQSFGYAESGIVSLTVQFDSTREAAYFLDSLNQSKWIKEATLSSLSAIQSETETNAADNTAASNSQTNTASTTNQTTTDSPATVNSQSNQATGTTSNLNGTNNNTSTTANANTVNNNQAAASTSTVSKPTNNYLPRYTGQFEIKFKKEAIKNSLKKSKKDGKGVTGS